MLAYEKRKVVVSISYHAVKAISESLDLVGKCDSPMLSDEGEQALCRLLDGFIERFRWRVSICA